MKASAYSDLSILIPAAGRGDRLGRGPKAFLELDGRPLVGWLAAKAREVGSEVIIAVPPEHLERLASLCPGCRGIAGGATRQETIALLAQASTKPWLLLQDAARPFATAALMRAVVAAARETGAAGAFLRPDVPVARIEGGIVREHFRPDQVGVFQAPQAFERSLLLRVLAEAEAQGWSEQSTVQLVLRAGLLVRAVPGEKTNLKLTTEADWAMATSLKEWLA
ncbi:MAG: 2-C-methyl-D-erythritol 4-phosphate cytidylyltransferase [Holophagaceae bacterium]|nr:2-C-methyl-D-erythritol 4-phosphate cytidylyltransferase [Holophagaceae bacterium]